MNLTMKEDLIQGYKLGADDYLTKPFDSEVLLMKIKAILKRNEEQQKENDNKEFDLASYHFNPRLRQLTHGDKTQTLSPKENELLKMLADEGHHTPFEKSSLHFLVTVDQATHIHLLKHRIGVSINGESARYKELKEDKTYLPSDWPERWDTALRNFTNEANSLYHMCLEELTPVLGRKRAKESARFFKTFNSQITMDVMFNWRSFYHFQK